mgnify:CR=1 FL=1|tara:strand:- start:37 stop:318 length:282 start_codon:yes stop_codon:yes gene_type:complete
MKSKIVLEITLESEAFVDEFKSDPSRSMDLCPIEEMTMIAGQCRLPWMTKGIKTVRWREKGQEEQFEFDVYRLQYAYDDIGQKDKADENSDNV